MAFEFVDDQQPQGRFVYEDPNNPAQQGGSLSIGPFDTGIQTSPRVDQFLSGVGRALIRLRDGSLQLQGDLGMGPKVVTRQSVDEQNRIDAPLMATTAGTIGDVVGNVAATLPLVATPAGWAGALAAGAGMGAAEPVGTNDSRTLNTAKGAALFVAPNALGAAYRAGKAFVEPLYEGGRNAIVGRTLDRFAGNDPTVLAKLQNPEVYVPGSMPTAADAAGSSGLAMLEGGATAAAPEAKAALKARLDANNAARVGALRDVAGDPAQMEFYKASRQQAAEDLYQRAFAEIPDETSPWIKGQLTQLMRRPAFIDALKQGQTDALNQGIKVSLDNPENATQILHLTKQALDDQISRAVAAGSKPRGLLDTRDNLVSLLESKNFSPSYREARDTYAKMSQPINQMEIGQSLYNKMVPALNDFGGTTRTRSAAFADAMRNGDVTAQRATGFNGAQMENIMSPEQMSSLNGVGRDLSRRAATEDAMRGVGSNTAQNLAVQNIMSQAGVPAQFSQNALRNLMAIPYIGGVLKFGTQGAENAVQAQLAQALLDPRKAAELLQRAQAARQPRVANALVKYLRPAQAALLQADRPQ